MGGIRHNLLIFALASNINLETELVKVVVQYLDTVDHVRVQDE